MYCEDVGQFFPCVYKELRIIFKYTQVEKGNKTSFPYLVSGTVARVKRYGDLLLD